MVRQYISHTSYMTGAELESALREANHKPTGNGLKPGEDLIIPGYESEPIVEHPVPVAKDFEVRAIYLTGTMAGSDHGIRIVRRWHELGGNAVVFDIKDSDGSVNIAFDHPPGKFVITPNAPVSQIWISALVSSFKLDWSESHKSFILPKTGEPLKELVGRLIGEQVGQQVQLT